MLIQSVVLGVLAALGWGIADFAAAVVSKRIGILRTTIWAHLSSLALASVYLVWVQDVGRISPGHWLALGGLAVLAVALYFAFYRALQIGPVAIVSPIGSAYAVVVIVLAVVIVGERLNPGQSIGAAGSICGVVMASVNLQGLRGRRELIGRGVALGLLAMIGGGVWGYAIGVLSRDLGWFLPAYLARLMTLALLLPFAAARRDWPWRRLTIPLLGAVASIGVLEMGGLFAYTRGAEVGVISIVAAASTTYPVLPILGGLFIFKERLQPSQFMGLALALGGLFILALSTG